MTAFDPIVKPDDLFYHSTVKKSFRRTQSGRGTTTKAGTHRESETAGPRTRLYPTKFYDLASHGGAECGGKADYPEMASQR